MSENRPNIQKSDMNNSKYFFDNLPDIYSSSKDEIPNADLKKIYSNITFHWFQPKNKDYEIKTFLNDFFKDFNFITYEIIPIQSDSENEENVNAIFCVEKQCVIINSINKPLILEVIDEIQSPKIDCSYNYEFYAIDHLDEEITNFSDHFIPKSQYSDFIRLTIRSISAFIIRRHFYPSYLFKDKSFFSFQHFLKNEKISEQITFNEKDFIFLRTIYCKDNKTIFLVIHIDSLCIFALKKVTGQREKLEREAEFYKSYYHRCFVPFYGFISNEKYFGFVYEFMCNGNLHNIILNSNKFSFFYLFMSMIRIFQAINYLHSNNYIHRDIKPFNILIDHDYIPYVSDFEHTRLINEDNSIELTSDIGSVPYQSPEQYHTKTYSFSTDIYSFGVTAYFIFERKNMFINQSPDKINKLLINNFTPDFINTPEQIREIIVQCVKYIPDDRISNQKIIENIINQIKSFYFFEKSFIKNQLENIKHWEIVLFASENKNFLLFDKRDDNLINDEVYFYDIILHQDKIYDFYDSVGQYYVDHQKYDNAKYFFELAIENNSHSLYRLGRLYYFGYGVNKNLNTAKEYYEKSVEKNNPVGMVILGNLYKFGEGVDRNIEKAIELYKKGADLNEPIAFNSLGILYNRGIGVDQDTEKSLEYFKQSADLNNAYGMIYMANISYTKKKFAEAKKYYELAVQQHEPEALIGLGAIYLFGSDVEQDTQMAIQYFEKAAKENNSNGYMRLADMYYNGKYVEANYQKAKEYFEKAAELKNSDALIGLGMLYSHGFGVKRDYKKAMEYFERSSNLNNSSSFMYRGNLYLHGQGVKRNYKMAKELFEISAQKGNYNALIALGILYLRGYGVEKDIKKAIQYFQESASKGSSGAKIFLGDLHLRGLGNYIDRNYKKALEYYSSVERNQKTVLYKIGDFYENGFDEPHDYTIAREHYNLSAKLGSSYALICLGNFNWKGLGNEENKELIAIDYYQKAAQKDNTDACIILGNIYMKCTYIEKTKRDNYEKASYYFGKVAEKNNPEGFYYIGKMFFKGYGFKQNYEESRKYFEKAAQVDYSKALFVLGLIYENGLGIEPDVKKAIECYSKCGSIDEDVCISYDEYYWHVKISKNNHFYSANNNLGLIYLIIKRNIVFAEYYLKIPAYSDFTFGQNNFGLIRELFFDDKKKAELMYENASKNQFALAEFNLARIKEKNGSDEEEINKHYINASSYENIKLKFQNHFLHDENLEISKIFIIFLTNIKLVSYYLSKNENKKAIKYLLQAIFRPLFKLILSTDNLSHSFTLTEKIDKENLIDFILHFPFFDLSDEIEAKEKNIVANNNWKTIEVKYNKVKKVTLYSKSSEPHNNVNENLNSQKEFLKHKGFMLNDNETEDLDYDFSQEIKSIFEYYNVDKHFEMEMQTDLLKNLEIIQIKSDNDDIIRYFEYPNVLFTSFFNNIDKKMNEIDEIIRELNSLLYNKHKPILFGRIKIKKNKSIPNNDRLFKEGFSEGL
ncbi:hypothetical protein M9Y10_035870 [Tritrichomonas musculus]|uniref:Protein kinase domain-containing protein n=1 Tax=Tritrichomonas musculus TaxID=1915356 RepID=A0ABR2GVG7_9EUKA